MQYLTLEHIDVRGKRVLVREDFNVPMREGRITDDTRIRAALPTIHGLMKRQAQIILMSHLGRPAEGKTDPSLSLSKVADHLSSALSMPVTFVTDYLQKPLPQSPCILLENVRFNPGEKANDPSLAKAYANLCDVFVMDAFAAAHRAQASTVGVANYAPIACAGPLLIQEMCALDRIMVHPAKPFVAIVGGAKISSKLPALKYLINKVDGLIVGGGIANTFLAAKGYEIGQSLVETDMIPVAKELLAIATRRNIKLPLPTDVVVAKQCTADAITSVKQVGALDQTDMILDIGPKTITTYSLLIGTAATIIWSGPLGVFELMPFSKGTIEIAQAVANNASCYSLAGGGDTLAALYQSGFENKISYLSTGGSAFLSYLQGEILPAVAVLQQRAIAPIPRFQEKCE